MDLFTQKLGEAAQAVDALQTLSGEPWPSELVRLDAIAWELAKRGFLPTGVQISDEQIPAEVAKAEAKQIADDAAARVPTPAEPIPPVVDPRAPVVEAPPAPTTPPAVRPAVVLPPDVVVLAPATHSRIHELLGKIEQSTRKEVTALVAEIRHLLGK